MEELPDDFAIVLGRILYLGGRVEMLLDRLLDPTASQPPRRGLSGSSLVRELRKTAASGSRLREIVDGYEAQHEWRNHLVHGSHQYSAGVLWTWREPTSAKGDAAFCFQFSFAHLQGIAENWRHLAEAAHAELHRLSDQPHEAGNDPDH